MGGPGEEGKEERVGIPLSGVVTRVEGVQAAMKESGKICLGKKG